MVLCTCFSFSVVSCKVVADLAFLVDSSGSIGRTNWKRMKRFLENLVGAFNIEPNGVRIAVVSYSTKAKLMFTFNTFSGSELNQGKVAQLISEMAWQKGFTYIDKALALAETDVFTIAGGMRPKVAKVRQIANLKFRTNSTRNSLLQLFLMRFVGHYRSLWCLRMVSKRKPKAPLLN